MGRKDSPHAVPNSINTSYGARIALQSLNSARLDLGVSQDRISTGLKVRSAGDDSAIYAISQSLQAQSAALQAVMNALDRGRSTVDVALTAAQSIADLLTQVKATVTAASDASLDPDSRAAHQRKYASLASQIRAYVTNAAFNGVNLLDGSVPTYKAAADADGGASFSLQTRSLALGRRTTSGAYVDPTEKQAVTAGAGLVVTQTSTFDVVVDGASFTVTLSPTGGAQGNGNYTPQDVAAEINAVPDLYGIAWTDRLGRLRLIGRQNNADVEQVDVANGNGSLSAVPDRLKEQLGIPLDPDIQASVRDVREGGGNILISGREQFGAGMDYSDLVDRVNQSIANVSATIGALGTASNAFANHAAFVGKRQDALTSGAHNLVDADVARERAKLTAAQIRQQLGLQALSIANAAPSMLLSLFQRA